MADHDGREEGKNAEWQELKNRHCRATLPPPYILNSAPFRATEAKALTIGKHYAGWAGAVEKYFITKLSIPKSDPPSTSDRHDLEPELKRSPFDNTSISIIQKSHLKNWRTIRKTFKQG